MSDTVDLSGKVCLVTGANSGIGLATVLELARRGFRSVGTVRSEAKAAVVADAASRSRAVAVFDSLVDLRAGIDDTPLG